MPFFARLADRIHAVDSVVSVGLDPDLDRLPESVREADLPRWAFNRRIIDATHERAAAYKPNVAFYEDPAGWRALAETIAYAKGKDVPVVLDAKRADVGHTARRYARLLEPDAYDLSEVAPDAITVNPYLGEDALRPFLEHSDKGVFVLGRTSNRGGADLQDRRLESGEHVYERVAALAAEWNDHGNVGLVVGATAPDELEAVRQRAPELPFLVPGVGAQGGDREAAVRHGLADGIGLINSSRGIIFAGEGTDRPFAAAGEAIDRLNRGLNRGRCLRDAGTRRTILTDSTRPVVVVRTDHRSALLARLHGGRRPADRTEATDTHTGTMRPSFITGVGRGID